MIINYTNYYKLIENYRDERVVGVEQETRLIAMPGHSLEQGGSKSSAGDPKYHLTVLH